MRRRAPSRRTGSRRLLSPVELRKQGFAALVKALGWVNAVRFLQQYEMGEGDYTKERPSLLPDWDAEGLVKRAFQKTR